MCGMHFQHLHLRDGSPQSTYSSPPSLAQERGNMCKSGDPPLQDPWVGYLRLPHPFCVLAYRHSCILHSIKKVTSSRSFCLLFPVHSLARSASTSMKAFWLPPSHGHSLNLVCPLNLCFHLSGDILLIPMLNWSRTQQIYFTFRPLCVICDLGQISPLSLFSWASKRR